MEQVVVDRPVTFLRRLRPVPTRRRLQLPAVRRDATRRHMRHVRRRDTTGGGVLGRRRAGVPVPPSALRSSGARRRRDAAHLLRGIVVVL